MNYNKNNIWSIKSLLLYITQYLTDDGSSKLMRCNKIIKQIETLYPYKKYYDLKPNRKNTGQIWC